MKILIIRFSSIGDIVLTTPVIRCLKKQLHGAEIHFLTKKQFASIVEPNPYITKVHVLANSINETLTELKNERFNLVIDLHKNLRSLKVKSALNVKSFSFNKLNIEKWLMTAFKWNILPDIHIVDRYLQTAFSTGVENDGEGLDYFIPSGDIISTASLPGFLSEGFISIVTGAAHATKKLPVEKMTELCKAIQTPIILIGGKEDVAAGEIIAAASPEQVFNGCGKYSLHQSASLVRQSRLVISHDTGFMHIAAALKKPVIAIWGNTIPEFGMYPYYGNSEIPYLNAEVKGLSCRPCSKIGYSVCPKKHFNCMNKQDILDIATKVSGFLK